MPSRLAVLREQDLALASVLENILRYLCAHRALQLGGALLHSAGIVVNERAWLFCGRSNAGKTTLSRKAFAEGAHILSDDINLVLPAAGGFRAYAVPFSGEFGRTLDHRGARDSYEVAAVVLLRQGIELQASTCSAARAAGSLLVGTPFVNTDAEETGALLESAHSLALALPTLRLASRRDDPFGMIMRALQQAQSQAEAA